MAYVTGESGVPEGCFICAATAPGSSESLVVERAELTVTLVNRYPYSSGHLLVAPRRHTADLRELSPEEGLAVLAATRRAVDAITREMAAGGFNVGFNLGRAAGSSVDHLHLHVVPRWDGDTNFMPVLADVKVLPEHLEVTAARLREALARASGDLVESTGAEGSAAGDPAERV